MPDSEYEKRTCIEILILVLTNRSFLDKIQEIRRPDYCPTDQDILRSRKRTTEIQKIEFSVKVSAKYGGGSQTFW